MAGFAQAVRLLAVLTEHTQQDRAVAACHPAAQSQLGQTASFRIGCRDGDRYHFCSTDDGVGTVITAASSLASG